MKPIFQPARGAGKNTHNAQTIETATAVTKTTAFILFGLCAFCMCGRYSTTQAKVITYQTWIGGEKKKNDITADSIKSITNQTWWSDETNKTHTTAKSNIIVLFQLCALFVACNAEPNRIHTFPIVPMKIVQRLRPNLSNRISDLLFIILLVAAIYFVNCDIVKVWAYPIWATYE